jgi:hypothetical protein
MLLWVCIPLPMVHIPMVGMPMVRMPMVRMPMVCIPMVRIPMVRRPMSGYRELLDGRLRVTRLRLWPFSLYS